MFWRAGLVFGFSIFAIGFALGTVRTLLIAPYFGELAAVALELPVMLAASWWLAGRIARRLGPLDGKAALMIGGAGFAVLMLGEFAVGIGMMAQTPARWVAGFSHPAAQLGLAAQLVAVAMPWLRTRRRPKN